MEQRHTSLKQTKLGALLSCLSLECPGENMEHISSNGVVIILVLLFARFFCGHALCSWLLAAGP